jgi:hypothetical protein
VVAQFVGAAREQDLPTLAARDQADEHRGFAQGRGGQQVDEVLVVPSGARGRCIDGMQHRAQVHQVQAHAHFGA